MCHVMKLSPYVLCFVTFAAGCAEVIPAAPGDASPAADTPPPPDLPDAPRIDAGACTLPGGGTCALGAVCPAGDGCNTCMCTERGPLCTLIGCAVPDAGPPPPPVDAGGCTLPNGTFCAGGVVCPAGDGCNVCRCAPEGGAMCTTLGCTGDAGPRTCLNRGMCNPWEDCIFTAPGCGLTGTCGSPRDCASITPYCGCDAQSFLDCPGGTTTRPYRSVGACPDGPDGGLPGRCDGAHIGRGGGYCAGPSDAPLPLDCCMWNCDQRSAACESLPPTCPAGTVNTVANGCWGPCVPATACLPFMCATDRDCVGPWRCDTMAGRCVPRR
jgi:hypothetical protein